jgi:serine protease inhibitor
MLEKRKLYRLNLLATLSLVYGCQGSQSDLIANQNPLPISRLQNTPSPKTTSAPELRILALSSEEVAEVKANPIVSANNRFAFKLFNALSDEQLEKNLFVSPLSVSLALQMTWNGAKGETKAEMAKALEIDGLRPEQVNRGSSLLIRKLHKPAEDIQLAVANGIFANDRFELIPEFVKMNKENFFSEIRSIHFSNGPTQAEINAWANEVTEQKIPQLLSPVDPDPKWAELTVMYLLNALYFKADWSRKFEEFETQDKPFRLSDGNKKNVPMMRQFGQFHYLPPGHPQLKNDFQALELPYGNQGKISMYLFLPGYGSPLNQIRQDISKMDMELLFRAFGTETGSLTLPKFKQEWEQHLGETLHTLGIKQAFDMRFADFSAMAKPRTPLDQFYLSDVFQKAQIDVNEKGTTASAVTYVEVSVPASSEPQRALEMICDRPFLYLIRDNQTGQILFMGNVYDPSLIPSDGPSGGTVDTNPSHRPDDKYPSYYPYQNIDVSVVDRTTFNGKIFDDNHAPLDGVTVKAVSMNTAVPYEAETYSTQGTYAFNRVPSGAQIQITVNKLGYSTRKRIEVLKSNNEGDPNSNRYDFGNDGVDKQFSVDSLAPSDKPEVIKVNPTRNGTGIDPETSFDLHFSKPMDRKSVEDTFAVFSFNQRKLSVDSTNLSRTYTLTGNDLISNNFLPGNSSQIWDKSAFNVSWNSDDTEATFSFKELKQLPSDRDSLRLPDYNLAFRSFDSGNRTIKDKSGISRSENHFKLTEGDFEESYKFSIKPDQEPPSLASLSAETTENGGLNGDAVRLKYSEPMIFSTRDISIMGGMGNHPGAEQNAPAGYPGSMVVTGQASALNYLTTVIQAGGNTTFASTWGALGGTAVYDTADPTHKTVLLLPPVYTNAPVSHAYLLGALLSTAPGNYVSDGNANTAGVVTLLRTNGLANQDLNFNLSSNLLSNQAIAADLQNALNAAAAAANPPVSAQAFRVTASTESPGILSLQFNDTSGNYAGFAIKTEISGQATDTFPVLKTGGATLQGGPGQKLELIQPGDTVKIKVKNTVMDPAGNTLDSLHDSASGSAS